MSKKEIKEFFNLNSYEWWRNHRRIVTFGGFLILFALYLSPVIKEANNKNRCIKISKKVLLFQVKKSDARINKIKNQMGVSPKEFSEWQAYKDCNSNYKFGMDL
tara:strand:+ start:214 stop:525 length:312 start_codon:yes stop_codon:yes gene_type:complete